MIIILLLVIIACCLLFGSSKTKDGISTIILSILFIALIGTIIGSCGG